MRELMPLFGRPSHYAGIENNAVIKDPARISLHVALAFPDTYEVGMSYLGQKILYEIINGRPQWWAERVMAPDPETARVLTATETPLASLESDTNLSDFALVGFSVTHELCCADILHMLDLGNIPLRQCDRKQDIFADPLIIAGGGAMLGAEPLSPFFDLVCLGDGEEMIVDILELLEKARENKWSRNDFLKEARHIRGVYVPSLFIPGADGQIYPVYADHKPARRIVADLDQAPYPISQVTPVGAVHDRLSLEIARGCGRGCRFCHAGMVYRPVRERSPETVAGLLEKCISRTGFDEISFLALSAGDCTALKAIYSQSYERCQKEQITLALPSLRVGSVDDEILETMAAQRRPGITLAPEAGSQRLRDVINKGITEADLLLHIQKLLEHGWRHVKLYFMIGLPTESDSDLEAIAALCRKVRDAGGPGAPKMQVTASVSPFVPKPFTPFQWERQPDLAEITRRIDLLRNMFRNLKGIRLKWHEPAASHLEGILSRGDRRLADVIELAYRKGAVLCGWSEFFDLTPWLEALKECGLDAAQYICARNPDSQLPWEHINAGIKREFLLRERKRAYMGLTTGDCRFGACQNCGSCGNDSARSCLAQNEAVAHRLINKERDQKANAPAIDEKGLLALRFSGAKKPAVPEHLKHKAMRLRIWHTKTGGAAYLSQLELQSVIMRTLRRAKIPVAFSQGFHPLPLLSFGRALPVGVASEAEWFEITLCEKINPESVREHLHLGAGLNITAIMQPDERAESSVYELFSLEAGADGGTLAGCFEEFFKKSDYPFARTTKKGEKTQNVRPLLRYWKPAKKESGGEAIVFSTDWSQGYISPLLLVKAIISPSLKKLDSLSLIKLQQHFKSGYAYGIQDRLWSGERHAADLFLILNTGQ